MALNLEWPGVVHMLKLNSCKNLQKIESLRCRSTALTTKLRKQLKRARVIRVYFGAVIPVDGLGAQIRILWHKILEV